MINNNKEFFQDDLHAGYYRLPKCVVLDKQFKKMSNKSKILYAIMLERMSLSELNKWEDQSGKIYIYFTIDSIVSEMGISVETAVKCRKELSEYNLIEIQKSKKKES